VAVPIRRCGREGVPACRHDEMWIDVGIYIVSAPAALRGLSTPLRSTACAARRSTRTAAATAAAALAGRTGFLAARPRAPGWRPRPGSRPLRSAPTPASRAFPPWNRSILAEIDLCHTCSYQEIEDGHARTGGSVRIPSALCGVVGVRAAVAPHAGWPDKFGATQLKNELRPPCD
jgi:hypothetical protein